MNTLLWGVLAASFLGSLHCAGMCGPFAFLAATSDTRFRRSWAPPLFGYHGARLVLYASLGCAAGTLGYAVDWGGKTTGIQQLAAWLGGLSLVVYAILRLAGGIRFFTWPNPAAKWTAPLSHWLAASKNFRGWKRGAVIGMVSSLMPCGWLYAFVLAAAATGKPLSGAALMLVFWLGTVPILVAFALGIGRLARPLATRAPALASLVLLVIGLGTIVMRGAVDLSNMRALLAQESPSAVVEAIDQTKLPCCANCEERE